MIRELFKFNGGVKPPTNKTNSTTQPIAEFLAVAPMPAELVIPLHQSVGGTPRPLVKAGDKVLKGQRIGGADGNFSSAVHASTSGTVKAVEMRRLPHTSGLSGLCVVITPDGEDRWIERTPFDYKNADATAVQDYLRDAGVVGLGGAVFPSHLKLNPGRKGKLDTLVINGAECEPFITCDDMQMREQAAKVVRGAAILREVINADQVLIGIEDNKLEAAAAMKAAATEQGESAIEVVVIPTRYPAGGAKQLIRVLTGIEVPHGERSTSYGVQCFNTGTAYAIYEAIELGQPLISRVVTVAGNVEEPRNYVVPFGVPMSALAALAQAKPDSDRIVMGGPMMGVTMPGNEVPVVKATNCVLVGSPALFPPPPAEMNCIRCGECARACPVDLQPFEMYWFSRAKIFDKLEKYHLSDCIECGCCSYVCPSHIPLVDYYRFAKSEIWAKEQEKIAADAARDRHEFRLAREEREKQEKAARLAARTSAAREKAAAKAAEEGSAVSASTETSSASASEAAKPAADDDAKKAMIAAAMERARLKKEAAAQATSPSETKEQATE